MTKVRFWSQYESCRICAISYYNCLFNANTVVVKTLYMCVNYFRVELVKILIITLNSVTFFHYYFCSHYRLSPVSTSYKLRKYEKQNNKRICNVMIIVYIVYTAHTF